MVSLYPKLAAQDHFYMVDPMKMGRNSLPTTASSSTSANANLSEDPNKKVRKPYTITKSRESWTEQEHDKFLEALQLFDRDWKKIEAFVGSKTVIQIRSHAQKYFLKVQKNGTSEHVPPARPKRKAAHPYPQKAPKNGWTLSQVTGPFQSSAAPLEPGYVIRSDSLSVPQIPISGAAVPPVSALPITKDDVVLSGPTMAQYCCSSSNESTPRIWPRFETNNHVTGKHSKPTRVMPDFAQVYSFIGSVFDPNESGHLQKLKMMDPINLETVVVLMKNLSLNLTSPEFEDHIKLLSSYDMDAKKVKSGIPFNILPAVELRNAIPSV